MSVDAVPYYLGLDCGTNSVGWAVTDEEYNLLRAKGKNLWGVRLFDEANFAQERRLARTSRRRLRRCHDRIKLLELLFADEMAQVDPEFFLRMQKSFLQIEDKDLTNNTSNTLFADPDFQDKNYHKLFPTIWHLRWAIIQDDPKFTSLSSGVKLRLYYLAIHHIFQHRGHFLREGKIKGAGSFAPIYQEFIDIAANYGFEIDPDAQDRVEALMKNKDLGVRDKRKQLKDLLFVLSDDDNQADISKRSDELAGLIAGSKITPRIIFEGKVDKEENPKELSFSKDDLEEKLADIEQEIGVEQTELILTAKKIYDYGILSQLLGNNEWISAAMVHNYDLHHEQLKQIKDLLKNHHQDYKNFFKVEKVDKNDVICYNAYIGKAYTKDGQGRKSYYQVSQEDINKEIVKLLEKHALETPLLEIAKRGELLPKQRGQAKGTIPQQLHHNELEEIVQRLTTDFPSFGIDEPEENSHCHTKAEKLLAIHSFRIPYYCGPIKNDFKDNPDRGFAWGDEEIKQLVRPWNFANLVNLDQRATTFIKRMTNKCIYLPTEDVLPKASLLYQKYMVLNELNNLKFNGQRLTNDVPLKQKIYEEYFASGIAPSNLTSKRLEKDLKAHGLIDENIKIDGTSETKFLPRLSTHQDFVKILGVDYREKYTSDQLEEVANVITILGNEKKMLTNKIKQILGETCTDAQAQKLARKSYTDWARFSATFLTLIKATANDQEMSLIDALWETNNNLMELLSEKYGFTKAIQDFNHSDNTNVNISYHDLTKLYCSAPVRRTIWQALRVTQELVKVKGNAPTKIFLEATRGGEKKPTPKYTQSRHKFLIERYEKLSNSPDQQALLESLESQEPRNLQSKKLYLYYTQMGHCAYCGKHIDLEELTTNAYDIDHIYPQSLTKDDSLTNNNVLVCAHCNRIKTNRYPLSEVDPNWQAAMRPQWDAWLRAGLITNEKHSRLVRTTPLSTDELSKFIARQLVETSQSVKLLRDCLQQMYPDTKIILVKSGQVNDFRHHFAQGVQNEERNINIPPRPEFVKVRALNDLHHAQDAYLNIVVGNVMNTTFTNNPYKWLQEKHFYSLKPEVLWKETPNDKHPDFPKAWHFQDTIEKVSKTLQKQSSVLWTRQTDIVTGAISGLMIVGKNKNPGVLPIKKGLDVAKYGGYNSIKGAYFSLIEVPEKKGLRRKLVQVPILALADPIGYLQRTYPEAKIVCKKIEMGSLMQINSTLMRISGRTGNSIIFAPARQICIHENKANLDLHKVINLNQKLQQNKQYKIDEIRDEVDKEKNLKLYNLILDKLSNYYHDAPSIGSTLKKFSSETQEKFLSLGIDNQCQFLANILTAFSCNTSVADLSLLLPAAAHVGKITTSNDITDFDEAKLILQSPTGLFERVIDLKTIQPKG